MYLWTDLKCHINGLVQERHNSIANALELCLSCTQPSKYSMMYQTVLDGYGGFARCGLHNNDVIMGAIASQITSLTIVYSIIYSDADQRKYQSSASLVFVQGIHWGQVNSLHKWPVTRKMFPFDDVIMCLVESGYKHSQTVGHFQNRWVMLMIKRSFLFCM